MDLEEMEKQGCKIILVGEGSKDNYDPEQTFFPDDYLNDEQDEDSDWGINEIASDEWKPIDK